MKYKENEKCFKQAINCVLIQEMEAKLLKYTFNNKFSNSYKSVQHVNVPNCPWHKCYNDK